MGDCGSSCHTLILLQVQHATFLRDLLGPPQRQMCSGFTQGQCPGSSHFTLTYTYLMAQDGLMHQPSIAVQADPRVTTAPHRAPSLIPHCTLWTLGLQACGNLLSAHLLVVANGFRAALRSGGLGVQSGRGSASRGLGFTRRRPCLHLASRGPGVPRPHPPLGRRRPPRPGDSSNNGRSAPWAPPPLASTRGRGMGPAAARCTQGPVAVTLRPECVA